jgi:rhodanese-related sulfurtransferase
MKHLNPRQAHAYQVTNPQAVIVDVRTRAELQQTGTPVGALNIVWVDAAWEPNPLFMQQIQAQVALDTPVLLICRSGKRSADAGTAMEAAGYRTVINVAQGFEGDANAQGQRGQINGWTYDGLPAILVNL